MNPGSRVPQCIQNLGAAGIHLILPQYRLLPPVGAEAFEKNAEPSGNGSSSGAWGVDPEEIELCGLESMPAFGITRVD